MYKFVCTYVHIHCICSMKFGGKNLGVGVHILSHFAKVHYKRECCIMYIVTLHFCVLGHRWSCIGFLETKCKKLDASIRSFSQIQSHIVAISLCDYI